MDILNVTTTKSALSRTGNGRYNIEYSIENKKLTRALISIFSPEENNESYTGNISLENGTLNCTLHSYEKAHLYMKDFEDILEQIREDIEDIDDIDSETKK